MSDIASTNGHVRVASRREREQSHDHLAERSVLGAMLLDPMCVSRVVEVVRPSDYLLPRHKAIAFAIERAIADRGTVDPIIAAELLRGVDRLEEVGGVAELFAMADEAVHAASAVDHAHIVAEHARRRRVLEATRRVQLAAEDGATSDELRALLAAAAAADGQDVAQARPLIEFRSPWQMASLPPRQPQWRDYFNAGELVVPYGPWGCCKSFVAMGLMVAMADGARFLGHDVTPGPSGLVCGEGAWGQMNRLRAATSTARVADPDDPLHKRIRIACSMPSLIDPRGFDATVREIEKMDEQPAVLVFDTFARACSASGLSEDETGDNGLMVAAFDRLRSRFDGTTIMPIHHSGYAAAERMRGSSVLPSAADVVLRIEPLRTSSALPRVRLSVDKKKDGKSPPPLLIDFAEVVVGQDDRGQPVTSLRVDSFTIDSDDDRPADTKPLTAKERLRAALHDAGAAGIDFDGGKKVTSRVGSTTSDGFAGLVKEGAAEPFTGPDGEKRWRLRTGEPS
ncbi:MAG: AAA family ATPase [Planctomycetota bacterium]